MQQAGVELQAYGHPVLILATRVARNEDGLSWTRVAVVDPHHSLLRTCSSY